MRIAPVGTPLDRLATCADANPVNLRALTQLRATLGPFALAQQIDQGLARSGISARSQAGGRRHEMARSESTANPGFVLLPAQCPCSNAHADRRSG